MVFHITTINDNKCVIYVLLKYATYNMTLTIEFKCQNYCWKKLSWLRSPLPTHPCRSWKLELTVGTDWKGGLNTGTGQHFRGSPAIIRDTVYIADISICSWRHDTFSFVKTNEKGIFEIISRSFLWSLCDADVLESCF